MEAAADDIEYAKGEFRIAGTDRVISLAEVARAEPGLHGSHRFDPTASTYPNGCHVAEVEIDPETGTVALVAYAMVQDAGRIVNPVIVAGQLHGGVAHGIGQALMERTVYDPASGQMLSGTWLDYCMPRADDLPSFVYEANQVRCLTNPLGVKAAGESGPVAAPPAVIGAICDALRDYGITDVPMPATAETVWRLIRDAEVRIMDP